MKMMKFCVTFLSLFSLFIPNITAFKALDSYKLDAGEFPFNSEGATAFTNFLTRFYVLEGGTCERFSYKGSGGNTNNFGTQHECQRHLAELSFWESLDGCKEGYTAPGPCTQSNNQYFGYVASSKTCVSFNYGGCGGNSNRFQLKTSCEKACDEEQIPNEYDCYLLPKYPTSDNVKIAIVMSKKLNEQKCHYAIVNEAESRGIFPSFSKCLTTCFEKNDSTPSLIPACGENEPTQFNDQTGNVVGKFYYKPTEKACLPFLTKERTTPFNKAENYFETEEECMSYCPVDDDKIEEMSQQISKGVCNMASDPESSGSLTGVTKWYHKGGDTPACTSIVHGGVGDTNGLFDSEEECNILCGP